MLTVVTGANSKYFKYLKQILKNVLDISLKNNITIRIIVYNLGMIETELKEIKLFQNIIIKHFDFKKFPEHVSLKKYYGRNCSYAWKPIIIYDVCEKYGGLVHWMDTANIYSDFSKLIKILETEYIYSPKSSGTIKKWTHPTCINYMNGYKYENYEPRSGGIVAFNYNIQWVKQLVKEWKDLALIKNCIVPFGSNKLNHRQDQAILSILFYKYQEKYKFKDICHYIDLTPHNQLKI